MNETKKTLAILKARWPEVFLIIGFSTLGNWTTRLLKSFDSDSTLVDTLGCSSMLFFLSLMIISTILEYGFLRTVHLEGSKKHTPTDLLKTGKHFFWRIFGACLMIGILYFILKPIIFVILKKFASTDTGFWELAKSNPLLYNLNVSLAMLILIKLVLLIPSLIIVLDCRISDSFDFLKKCKLTESKELVALYLLGLTLPFVLVLLKIPYKPETISEYILRIGNGIILQIIWLIIAIMAVRFVGSLNLVYDSGIKDTNSENLVESPKEE